MRKRKAWKAIWDFHAWVPGIPETSKISISNNCPC